MNYARIFLVHRRNPIQCVPDQSVTLGVQLLRRIRPLDQPVALSRLLQSPSAMLPSAKLTEPPYN